MRMSFCWILLISIGTLYYSCDSSLCKFEEFVIPVEISPMKDTFHIGDTIHVHIKFPKKYIEGNNSYYISSEVIDFMHVVEFLKDTSILIETALKNSKLIVDTSRFDVFIYRFQDGSYSILGDITETDENYLVDYSFTLNQVGTILSFYIYFPVSDRMPAVEFEEDCEPREFNFKLKPDLIQRDNYEIYYSELIENGAFPPKSRKIYRNSASFTFYVVE